MAQGIARSWSGAVKIDIADSLVERSRTRARYRKTGRGRSLFTRHIFLRHVQKLCRSRRSISRARAGTPLMKMKISKLFPKQKTARQRGGSPVFARFGRSVRRHGRAEHEAVARAADRADPACRGRFRHHRVQCDQDAAGFVCGSGIGGSCSAKRPPRGVFAGANRTERGKCRGSPENIATLEKARPVTHSLPIELAAKPADSGKIYVVVKGDNPVTIAKKLKVSYDDLLELNHINDPRKLQIGQKLLIPKDGERKEGDE